MRGRAGHVSFSVRALIGLAAIQRYRYLSVEQFARAAGLKPSFVRDLLRDYERRSVLSATGNVGLLGGSKAPKLYYLTETGHMLVAEALGPEAAVLEPWRKPHNGLDRGRDREADIQLKLNRAPLEVPWPIARSGKACSTEPGPRPANRGVWRPRPDSPT